MFEQEPSEVWAAARQKKFASLRLRDGWRETEREEAPRFFVEKNAGHLDTPQPTTAMGNNKIGCGKPESDTATVNIYNHNDMRNVKFVI